MQAAFVWGISEDRIFTVIAFTGQGRCPKAELHVYLEDEGKAFTMLQHFARRWGITQMFVEALTGVTAIKECLDGPLLIETANWKAKMAAAIKLQTKFSQLNVQITPVEANAENYTVCAECGEPLERDMRMRASP